MFKGAQDRLTGLLLATIEKLSLCIHPGIYNQRYGLVGDDIDVSITEVAPGRTSLKNWISNAEDSISSTSLVNGGTAGFVWVFFICWMGFLLINTSMAEMASM